MNRALLGVLLLAALSVGCQTSIETRWESSRESAPAPGRMMARTELIFGLGRRGGGVVTEAQWQDFVEREVVPRFPDGFTIVPARGEWRGGAEEARVLLLLHDQTPQADRLIEEIRASYKRQFDQESVLRADVMERVRL